MFLDPMGQLSQFSKQIENGGPITPTHPEIEGIS